MFALGGAAVAAGAVLFFTDHQEKATSTGALRVQAGPVIAGSTSGVVVRGAW